MQKTVAFISVQNALFRSNPQVAFITSQTWAIRGAYWSQSGLMEWNSMPILPAGVPVVNLEGVKNQQRRQAILSSHCSPAGVDDVPTLLRELCEIGAQVMYAAGGEKINDE